MNYTEAREREARQTVDDAVRGDARARRYLELSVIHQRPDDRQAIYRLLDKERQPA